MSSNVGRRAFVGLLLGLLWAIPALGQALERYAFSHPQMGTTFRIVVFATEAAPAADAAAAAFARIDTLNARLSDYLSGSELSRLSASAGTGRLVPVSDDLWAVLLLAQRIAAASEGAFDVSVGPLTRLWRWAMRRQHWPPADRLQAAQVAVGYEAIGLESTQQAVRLERAGMRLDLGGIAKGYAADEAMRVLQAHRLPIALVDAGGDLVLGAPPPGTYGWTVSVPALQADGEVGTEVLEMAHTALAVSGDTYRYLEWDGRRYAHILDPRTGLGMTDRRRVAVQATTGVLADALASAFSVMAPGEALDLAAQEGVSALILRQTEGSYQAYRTPSWRGSLRQPTKPMRHP